MQPPARKSRTTNNPGTAALPKSRRSSSEVAAEKQKKKDTAAANVNKKREQAARVARVEREIEAAQKEAGPSRKASQIKRKFPRPTSLEPVQTEVSHVSLVDPDPDFS